MNKKLFDTRMNSVLHYQEQIKDLKEAIRVTETTLFDLSKSFAEFIPFKIGDVVLIRDRVMKITEVSGTDRYGDEIRIELQVNYPDNCGGYRNRDERITISFTELDNVKILFSEPEKEN
jgi:hypothetical protein